ncbi:MAG: UDP-N-acetylglucosamine 2-epimerase (non-hydrolyzing) [Bacteroidetes bacterium CG18_big_fil_WC_8_21_14_2_50_41_14]|nr:MAG: UDP-N-acetylglucosamine 2-epimerase (non-hydrolyzing) [Bacteroidetes bacterium CG18_big_fil_WC_8_21_14_2_50_41_14]
MKKIVTVIGARPQIIKAAALSRAIADHYSDQITEVIVHTGQHYDTNMSKVFIDELGIPQPAYNLQVGSASHGIQTARIIEGLEDILLNEKPDYLVLYGDTNSTLAGAIAASKIHIPIVHIEAGLRSFNKRMPEEINRILCDHASTLLFSPTRTGYDNLVREGFNPGHKAPFHPDHPGIFHCGDVMYDNSLFFKELAKSKSSILTEEGLAGGQFILATIHRDNNTDLPERLQAIFAALIEIAETYQETIVLPLHPRTSQLLEQNLGSDLYLKLQSTQTIKILPPVSFLDMIQLESNCKLIITDSGGVQKEAYFFQKPGIILRSETEWVEIVQEQAAIVTNADKEKILSAYYHFHSTENGLKFPPLFGDGKAAEFICETILG